MNNVEIKNQLDLLLKQLSTERSFDVAEKIATKLADLLNIKTKDRFLANISRVDAELTRFQLAPGFARQAAAYELPHEDNKPFDLKLFWIKKASKTNLSWIIGLTPNFEDAESNDYKNIGIDFVVPETCDSIIILLSNRFKIRALELKDHITPTQLEIFTQWIKLPEIDITDQKELKKTLHAKLWESFNFEPINRKFYLELVEHFSVLVHHLEKDLGRKPSVMFTTRLIGRLLFIWFLKKKNLINKNIDYFSISNTEKQKEYYENRLEKLFFEVLNTNELERTNGDKLTPYLNGGLFDKSTTDFFGDPKLTFPNGYFNQIFNTLNKYNFTVDESSPEFQHVAIDPEMLGRIFESLLAEQIDENTGNSKKKATGAFYTPREIVSYMCEQSLIEHLKTKVPEAPDRDRRIEELVRMPEAIFRDQDQNKRRDWKPYREAIIKALEGSKTESPLAVLDPAVGSGAFPMGMLHLLVKVYSRLDPKFEKDISGLKRDILSRSLYGVDIEQTAIEITRLRAWLSIIVDIPEGEKVEPLPNLEFKFVCANTLIPLDDSRQATFFTDHDLKDKLITIRDDYFKTSSKTKKEKLQKDYLKLTQNSSLFDNKKTQQLKSYKPFDISSSSEFYDPELMHGVQAFDIIIGNPPYVKNTRINQKEKKIYLSLYSTLYDQWDLYLSFFEIGLSLLKTNGNTILITPNQWLTAKYGTKLRVLLADKLLRLIDFRLYSDFTNAAVNTFVSLYKKESTLDDVLITVFDSNGASKTKNIKRVEFVSGVNNLGKFLSENNTLVNKINNVFDLRFGDAYKVGHSFSIPDFYKLSRLIYENKEYKEDELKLVNTGTLSLCGLDYGQKKFKYDGKNYIFPVIEKNKFIEMFPLRKIQSGPKLIISSMGGLKIDIDLLGQYLGTRPTMWLASTNINKLKIAFAFLNSKLINWYYKQQYSVAGMTGFKVRYTNIKETPMPVAPEEDSKNLVNLVDQILDLKKQNKDADIENLESQIDQLVYKLYDLTPEEIEIVENSSKK